MRHFTERVWIVGCPIARAEIAPLCLRFAAFLSTFEGDTAICDVGSITRPDGPTLEALARFQLTARRHGRRIRLHRARRELIELIELSGLGAVLPLYQGAVVGSALEVGREAKQREEPVDIEEVVDPTDPPA